MSVNLYQIDFEISRLLSEGVDPDTGEISVEAWEALSALNMERGWKLENIALAVKNLRADAEAYKAEEAKFAGWRKSAERQAERLSDFISRELNGKDFMTDRVRVKFRKSSAVKVADEAEAMDFLRIGHQDCIRVKPPEIDKTAVKRLLGAGVEVPGVFVEPRLSMQIK